MELDDILFKLQFTKQGPELWSEQPIYAFAWFLHNVQPYLRNVNKFIDFYLTLDNKKNPSIKLIYIFA